jgi:hypothetical protein
LAGWRAGQILTVALGLLVGVLILRAEPNPAGVGVGIIILVACGAMATWPVSGRTGDQWLPVLVRWGTRRFGGGVRVGGGGAGGGGDGGRGRGLRRMDCLLGLRLLGEGPRHMGVIHDQRGRTLTAALSLRGQGFALLGPDEQDRRVTSWSSVLATLAREGSLIRRVQWLAASFPDQGHGVRDYLSTHATADPASACVASYEALLSDIDVDACTHDVLLAVQVRVGKSVEVSRSALQRELSSLTRLLADADVVVEGVLGVDDFADRLQRTYEAHPVRAKRAAPSDGASAVMDPWPMAMEEEWSRVRVDGLLHATFWVAEWPRIEVRSDFLAPLLLGSERITLSVVMEPLGPEKAVRKVEASRTADLADSELRRRSGFMSTARHSRESEVLARRESELADGHASFRYSGFLTVSAATESELVAATDMVQHAASQARLVIRRLYGDQATAYTCTLPLARGLAGR